MTDPTVTPLSQAELDAIIRPLPTPVATLDWNWRELPNMLAALRSDQGVDAELTPDFQRGRAWTDEQQRHYIENALRGVLGRPAKTISFNAPSWRNAPSGDLRASQCIDGLQRILAVQAYLAGRIRPFGLSYKMLQGTRYDAARPVSRLGFHLAVFDFQRRVDLLSYYLDINAGGTPHSPAELQRVRDLLVQEQTEADVRVTRRA